MPTLLDLSHTIEADMPRFPGLDAPHISAVWTHAEAAERGYQNTSCELTEVHFVTSMGTYLDAPYHFDPQGADISQLTLAQLVLPGLVLDMRDWAEPDTPLAPDALDGLEEPNQTPVGASHIAGDQARISPESHHQHRVRGKALLLNTGWSDHWGDDAYYHPPFVSRAMAERLRALRPALVGIDTLVIDSVQDPTRPAHTVLLRSGILIVENLTGLSELIGRPFIFFAVPAKIAGAAAFPVRAFAMLHE
jgi:arylformamidase